MMPGILFGPLWVFLAFLAFLKGDTARRGQGPRLGLIFPLS